MNNLPDNDEPLDLSLFFALSRDFLCIAGFDGHFKRFNPAFIALMGYSEEELLSRPIDSFMHPEDRQLTIQHRENIKNNIPMINYENRYITRAGDIVWLSWTSIALKEQQLIYAIAKDVTHKKQLETDRNVLLAQLSQINEDLKRVSYTLSHDLRSSVNNLLAIFSLLDSSKINDQETVQFIELLKGATDNLKHSLNQHVDILSQKNRMHVQVETVELTPTLNRVIKSLGSLIQHSRAILDVDFSACENVQFNVVYLESIFLNLITTAIKYAKPGVRPVINIEAAVQPSGFVIKVSDNGQGFDLDRLGCDWQLYQSFTDHVVSVPAADDLDGFASFGLDCARFVADWRGVNAICQHDNGDFF
jgi:PAS domain S-box-containing protein